MEPIYYIHIYLKQRLTAAVIVFLRQLVYCPLLCTITDDIMKHLSVEVASLNKQLRLHQLETEITHEWN